MIRVVTILIWLPEADEGDPSVLVKEFLCCLKMTLKCVQKLYYFMLSIENGFIVMSQSIPTGYIPPGNPRDLLKKIPGASGFDF